MKSAFALATAGAAYGIGFGLTLWLVGVPTLSFGQYLALALGVITASKIADLVERRLMQ